MSDSHLPEPEEDTQLDTQEEETQLVDAHDAETPHELVSGTTTAPADDDDEEPMEWPDSGAE
jgi:hypothetical protein